MPGRSMICAGHHADSAFNVVGLAGLPRRGIEAQTGVVWSKARWQFLDSGRGVGTDIGPHTIDALRADPCSDYCKRRALLAIMSQRLVKAGVWQGPAVRGDLRANLEQVAAAAAEAHTDGVEVLVFPELFALGPWRPGCHAED